MPFVGLAFMAYEIYDLAANAFFDAGQVTNTDLDTWGSSSSSADYVISAPQFDSYQTAWEGGSGGAPCTNCYSQADNASTIMAEVAAIPGENRNGINPKMHIGGWVSDNGIKYEARGAYMFDGSTSLSYGYTGGDCATGYVTVAKAEACTAQVLYNWLNATHPSYSYEVGPHGGGGRSSLYDFLEANPGAYQGLADSVMPWHESAKQEEAGYPSTYQNPYPEVQYDPVPNINQWHDNPYADPNLDTDGDGWKDWFETRIGSDPNNAGDYPCSSCDPDGDQYSNADEHAAGTDPVNPDSRPDVVADTDGDGVADSADPCPTDALNTCADGGTAEDLQKFFEGVAQEATLQDIRESVTGSASFNSGAAPALDTSALEAYTPALDATAFEAEVMGVGARFQPVRDAAAVRFPFALAGWIPAAPTEGTASCPDIKITYAGVEQPLAICGTQADDWLVTVARPVLVAMLYFGVVMYVAALVARS